MGQHCVITGKKPTPGNQYAHRGKQKYLGGVAAYPDASTRVAEWVTAFG